MTTFILYRLNSLVIHVVNQNMRPLGGRPESVSVVDNPNGVLPGPILIKMNAVFNDVYSLFSGNGLNVALVVLYD